MKLRFGVVGMLLALALAGCGDDEDPAPPDASPTSSATTAEPSEEPSETFDPTKETAKEFIRRWIRLGNEMQVSGETDAYLSIAGDNCTSCHRFVEVVEDVYDGGGWIKTDGERATSIEHDGKAQWTVSVDVAPTEYADTADGEVKSHPGGSVTYVVFIVRGDDRQWVLADYSKVDA